MITFEQIQKANEGLASIDVKGKDYVMVPQRVRAFRMLYPEGFIKTDILSMENGVCVMKTKVGYYENGHEIVLGTGLAYEKEANGYINKTSYIENCETSSVGRALGFLALGIDGGGICSAEELMNAVNNQKDNGRILPINKVTSKETKPEEKTGVETDLAEIRSRLEVAIKAKTKDMSKAEKVKFLDNVVTPALKGERNWRLCESPELLSALLSTIENKAA